MFVHTLASHLHCTRSENVGNKYFPSTIPFSGTTPMLKSANNSLSGYNLKKIVIVLKMSEGLNETHFYLTYFISCS